MSLYHFSFTWPYSHSLLLSATPSRRCQHPPLPLHPCYNNWNAHFGAFCPIILLSSLCTLLMERQNSWGDEERKKHSSRAAQRLLKWALSKAAQEGDGSQEGMQGRQLPALHKASSSSKAQAFSLHHPHNVTAWEMWNVAPRNLLKSLWGSGRVLLASALVTVKPAEGTPGGWGALDFKNLQHQGWCCSLHAKHSWYFLQKFSGIFQFQLSKKPF